MEHFSLRFVILLVLVLVVAASRSRISKYGCHNECGDVKIPYPFGFGEGCYLDGGWYEIVCNKSTNPPIPYISYNEDLSEQDFVAAGSQLLSINLDDQTFSVTSKIVFDCYNNPSNSTKTMSYTIPKYDSIVLSIPATKNQIYAIGCGATARFESTLFQSDSTPQTNGGGCTVNDSFQDPPLPEFCETSIISDGAEALSISVDNTFDTPCEKDRECYYAFVAKTGFYKFATRDLFASRKDCYEKRVPLVYGWSIPIWLGAAPRCGLNTEYVGGHSAYHCRCLQGYRGNPYLEDGCQDINECADKVLNVCEKPQLCVNKDGGFDCLCKHGHHGNGTKSNPCHHDPGLTKLIIDIAICMSSTVSFIILYVAYKNFRRRKHIQKRRHNFKKNGGLLLQQEMMENEGVIDRTKIFTESDLVRATDDFNSSRVLGHGGQGTVYKGMLADGTIAAVKKSKKVDANQVSQFINEVVILSQINHRNIVKLFGCCLETEVPLLVYEFVPNGTLYQYIHHPSEDFQMTWKVRSQIAVECAGAIAYLHSYCSSPIHHRDIKSSNILLDDKYKAKISDFGTSRSIPIDMSHVTTHVQGTFGYLDPEFFRSSQFSEKSDVYSFGVVMLELLTSRKPIYTDSFGEARSLAVEFVKVMETDNHGDQLHNILDPKILEHCPEEEIGGLVKLIMQCLSLSGSRRPTMKEVTLTLEMIRSQYGEIEEGDQANDQERTINQDGSLDSHEMNITDDSSFSVNMQPFSFDSDCGTIVM